MAHIIGLQIIQRPNTQRRSNGGGKDNWLNPFPIGNFNDGHGDLYGLHHRNQPRRSNKIRAKAGKASIVAAGKSGERRYGKAKGHIGREIHYRDFRCAGQGRIKWMSPTRI